MKEGWEMKRLGDVCKVLKRKHSGASLPYIGMEDIESSTGQLITAPTEKTVKSTSFQFNEKHILYGRLRPYLNKVFLPDFNGHCSTEIFPIECADNLDRRFLFFWLTKSRTVQKIDVTSTGTRMPRANIPTVLDFQIPVPPLPEQRRIVAILDEALAAIATATANAKKNLAHAQELFESELNRVFTQRGDGWVEKRLGDICILRNGRAYKKSELLEKGKYRVLRVGNFFTNKNWFYSDLELDVTKYCAEGDLLYAWSASFGPRIWNDGKVIYHYHIWRVDPNELVTKDFLYRWLAWDAEKIKAEHGAGTTMIHVSKASMEARVLHLPPISEQKVIIDNFRKLEKETRRLESIYQQKLALLAELKQSLLHKAFSGELRTNAKPVEKSLTEMGK